MQDSKNGQPAPSNVPDFNRELQKAQATGDFDFVLETAKQSHKMLLDFRDAIQEASFQGRKSAVVATGLNFLENMITQSAGNMNALKQTERATREAMKARSE